MPFMDNTHKHQGSHDSKVPSHDQIGTALGMLLLDTHCFYFILVHFKVWTNFFLSLSYELFHVEPKLKLAGFLDVYVYVRYMYACVH